MTSGQVQLTVVRRYR